MAEQSDIERLLGGYSPAVVPAALDQRILSDAGRLMLLARTGRVLDVLWSRMLDLFGFGYINWIADRLAGRETEYQLTII